MTPEDCEQAALFEWAATQQWRLPHLARMFAIPNGGHRHISVAKTLKATGVKAGVPDICLPVAVGRYHGLFIEMKTSTGRVQHNQLDWIAYLNKEGYCARVCYGWEQAKDDIENYLRGRLDKEQAVEQSQAAR